MGQVGTKINVDMLKVTNLQAYEYERGITDGYRNDSRSGGAGKNTGSADK